MNPNVRALLEELRELQLTKPDIKPGPAFVFWEAQLIKGMVFELQNEVKEAPWVFEVLEPSEFYSHIHREAWALLEGAFLSSERRAEASLPALLSKRTGLSKSASEAVFEPVELACMFQIASEIHDAFLRRRLLWTLQAVSDRINSLTYAEALEMIRKAL